MTHLELITFIYTHREALDGLYRKKLHSVEKSLEESMLVTKIGSEIELSDSYRQFIDTTLRRIDYGVIFHTYSAELTQLRKLKFRYLEEKKSQYFDEIYQLIKDIYFKLERRDGEIKLLLIKIENETSLDLDLLIEKATDILDKITEINYANSKVREVFDVEINAIDPRIDELMDAISGDMVLFIENISMSLNRLNQFIARTRKIRLQNRKLLQLSMQILDEDDEILNQLLYLSPKECYLTLRRSQKNTIQSYPDGSESTRLIRKLRQSLGDTRVVKESREIKIVPQEAQNLYIVDIEKIKQDLINSGADDIFLFIYHHPELKYLINSSSEALSLKEESFKIFLQIVIPQRGSVEMIDEYNSQEIRIARWI